MEPGLGRQGMHLGGGPGGEHVHVGLGKPGKDLDDLVRRLARAVHRLGRARAKGPVGIESRVAEVLVGKPPEPGERLLRRDLPHVPERLGREPLGGFLRLGLVHYNTADEVERLFQVLDRC